MPSCGPATVLRASGAAIRGAKSPSAERQRSRRRGIKIANGPAMNVTAISPNDTYAPPVDRSRRNYRHIRVLRWTFRRDDEAVVCELALTGEDREYELRAPADWNPTGASIERFDDALTAFQRHAMIERTLLDAGWQLEGFESER